MNHHFIEPEKLRIFFQTLWAIVAVFGPMCLFFGLAAWGVMRMRRFNRTARKP